MRGLMFGVLWAATAIVPGALLGLAAWAVLR